MAEIGYSIAGKLIEVLAHETIKEICRLWNYESQLERLKQKVETIQAVFRDADAKWNQLSDQDKDLIKKLKDAVYDAEDVFDEFHTRAMLNQLGKKSKVRKFFRKVRAIFSSDLNENHVYYAHKVSSDVREIMERLDAISVDRQKFNLQFDNKAIVRRPQETCSYVDAQKIVGRDKEKEEIISALLDPSAEEKFGIISIVGMGGMGKTTLAQLVLKDENVEKKFPDPTCYKLWVCVSDQQSEPFDEKAILCKILELTKVKLDNNPSKEYVQKEFQEKIRGKKYLLVLDDVWNEDREKWLSLEKFLRMGAGGSKIIVTTRSDDTASNIDSDHVYKLDGLSQEDAQHLFEMSAFGEREKSSEFLEIGKDILRKCDKNPLAIKVIGSLLYGQNLSKWKSIQKSGLTEIKESNDKILSILKVSYYNLTPSLKSCFNYCALFPKDTVMHKEMLIGLWMAQGYVVEDDAEEYFSILMRRCFFQDVVEDEYGNVVSVQIHDLMHDVAQEVVKEEICVVGGGKINFGKKIRHVNMRFGNVDISSCSSTLRSFIIDRHSDEHLCENLKALRVLFYMPYCGIRILPQRLLLLRYLNLSGNRDLEVLPDLITRLYNLQTLVLRNCTNLRKVPKDFGNLKNLRHLDLYRCDGLKGMPLGILKLTSLRVLPYFMESNEISNEEFKVLQQVFTNLKGKICIEPFDKVNDNKLGDLKSMKPLVKLKMSVNSLGSFKKIKQLRMGAYEGEWVVHEGVMEKLEPPTSLNEFELSDYKGTTIPWSTLISSLQYLLCVKIAHCENLEQISILSNLPKLKSLELYWLERVEYMENMMSSNRNDTNAVSELFPSLEHLIIFRLTKLKGWWKGDFPGMRLRFPRLTKLEIWGCPNLTSFAPCSNSDYITQLQLPSLCTSLIINGCPSLATNLICPPTLDKLILDETSSKLQIITDGLVNVREMWADKVDHLKLLAPNTNCLTSLRIIGDIEVGCALECVQSFVSSLQTLTFYNCKNLRRLPRLDHLIALEELRFEGNEELSICEEDDEEEPLKILPQSIRRLKFSCLPKMKILPKGFQYLTSLQSLEFYECKNMNKLPEWMSCFSSLQSLKIWKCPYIKSLPEAIKILTSLKKLDIFRCPALEERCQKSNGEDFSKIQHILDIQLNLHKI